jgi:NAD(P)-dependent dehydrogenase (short-subunit alcohol dehydrogenase family)
MGVVLITGCSSGFGLETALAFARRGDNVVASMRNPGKAATLLDRADRAGVEVEVTALDVTDDTSVQRAVDGVVDRHGSIDVLVNNAGVAFYGPFETLELERARAIMETNVWGAVRTARAVLPHMRSRGSGTVVNVSSIGGRFPGLPYTSFYGASKHALGALSESMAWELGPFGIRVVCVEPGLFTTDISANGEWRKVDTTSPYGADHAWVNEFMMKAFEAGGHPAVVADAVVSAVDDPNTPLHVLVGDDAIGYVDLASQAGSFEALVPTLAQMVEAGLGRPRPVRSKISS